ncbi:MAG: PilZ domain-containing protein [Planctomycetota bacterium]
MLHQEVESRDDCKRQAGRIRMQATSSSVGEVLDLSKSGMRVVSKRQIKPSATPTRVQIEVDDEIVAVGARVAWVRKCGLFKREAGLEFVGLSEDDSRRLAALARGAACNSSMASRLYGRAG